jgi:hypothetical protein
MAPSMVAAPTDRPPSWGGAAFPARGEQVGEVAGYIMSLKPA